MKPYSLQQRTELYNAKYAHLGQPLVIGRKDNEPFLYGYWFCFGTNVSDFYGAYSLDYLKRVATLFPDVKGNELVHLFSGSLPPGDYCRVGIDGTGAYKSDFQCDAHKLSSFLPFKPSLIMADPPYIRPQDIKEYNCEPTNRPLVLEECARVLKPGGYIVWLDDTLTNFSNEYLRYVGCITYAQSTGHRFRCVTIFWKPFK